MIFTPYSYYSLLQPTSHYWFGPKRVRLNHKTRVCLCATHREAQSVAGWSCRFLPTPSDSATTLMPASDSCCCGPMPDSISSWGLATVPLHSSSSPPGASSAAGTGGRQDTTHMGQLAAGIVWLRPVCLSSHGYSVHHTHKAWADCDGEQAEPVFQHRGRADPMPHRLCAEADIQLHAVCQRSREGLNMVSLTSTPHLTDGCLRAHQRHTPHPRRACRCCCSLWPAVWREHL